MNHTFWVPSDTQRQRLERWRISTFWVLMIGYIAYYLCRGNLASALPMLSQEFHYTNSQLGVILTCSELAYAVGKVLTGPWSDKMGGKYVFLIGLIGAVVANLWFTQVDSLLWLTVVWCVCRFFLSMGWAGVIKMMGAWYEPSRTGTMMGLVSTNFQLGGGLSILLSGWLLAMGLPWDTLFFVPAGLGAIMCVWAFFGAKESPDHLLPGVKFGQHAEPRPSAYGRYEEEKEKGQKKENDNQTSSTSLSGIAWGLLELPLFRMMLGFNFLTTLLRSIFFFWSAKFFVDMGMAHSGAIFKSAVFPFLGIVGTVFLGWYTDRYAQDGDRAKAMWVMLLGLCVSLLSLGLLVSFRGQAHGSMVFLLGASGFFLIGPYSMTSGCMSLDIAGSKSSGTASGLVDGVGYVGGSLGAWGAGILSDMLGWQHVFYMLSLVATLAVWCAYGMSQLSHKQQSYA